MILVGEFWVLVCLLLSFVQIGLAGFVKTAVEKLPGNPAPEAKLMWSETLDYGVNGLCWDIPALKAVQPACCGASSVINSRE